MRKKSPKFRSYGEIKTEEVLNIPINRIEREIFLVSLMSGRPVESIETMTANDFTILKNNLEHKCELNGSNVLNEWTYDFTFDNCTVQQFVDIEIIKSIFEFNEAMYRIVSVLMYNEEQKIYTAKEIIEMADSQPTENLKIYQYNRLKELNHYAKTEISVNEKLEKNYSACLKLPISWTWEKVNRFQENYMDFVERYGYIFKSDDVKIDKEEKDSVSVHENLYSLLMLSSDDDLDKMTHILNMNVNEWLTYCTYKMKQIEREIAKQKQMEAKNKSH